MGQRQDTLIDSFKSLDEYMDKHALSRTARR